MARVRIDLPDHLPFRTEIEVRVTDLNYGNHLGNAALLGILHEARVRFLAAHGMAENDCGGKPLVMADAAISYRAEGFLGDRLAVEVGIADLSRVGCDMVYRVVRIGDDALIAEAKTGIVFLDPATRRPSAVPERVVGLARISAQE